MCVIQVTVPRDIVWETSYLRRCLPENTELLDELNSTSAACQFYRTSWLPVLWNPLCTMCKVSRQIVGTLRPANRCWSSELWDVKLTRTKTPNPGSKVEFTNKTVHVTWTIHRNVSFSPRDVRYPEFFPRTRGDQSIPRMWLIVVLSNPVGEARVLTIIRLYD